MDSIARQLRPANSSTRAQTVAQARRRLVQAGEAMRGQADYWSRVAQWAPEAWGPHSTEELLTLRRLNRCLVGMAGGLEWMAEASWEALVAAGWGSETSREALIAEGALEPD
jgi:hypothetical protein